MLSRRPVIWKNIKPLVKSNKSKSAASPYGDRNARIILGLAVAAASTTGEAGITIVSEPAAAVKGAACATAGAGAAATGGIGTGTGATSMCAGI